MRFFDISVERNGRESSFPDKHSRYSTKLEVNALLNMTTMLNTLDSFLQDTCSYFLHRVPLKTMP